jgi:hypothetical protein
VGGACAADRPGAADHVENGEALILRSGADGAEIERIPAEPAELERIVARLRIDDAADEITGAESQRVAAAGKLDRRAAGADDRAAGRS